MARSPAVACPSPSVLRDRREVLVDIELAVVTPLFGGGAAPREADPLLPVRGSSVRGHLRFWWRACHAHRFASSEELFRSESEIWGKAAVAGSPRGPSPVDVEIEIPAGGEGQRDSHVPWEAVPHAGGTRWRPRWAPYPGYALFPFQGEAENGVDPAHWVKPPSPGRVGVRFRLRLTAFPGRTANTISDLRDMAESAVAAWILIGGIGARTRRGCGALWCVADRLNPEATPFRPRVEPPVTAPDAWLQIGQHVWLPRIVPAETPVTGPLKVSRLGNGRAVAGAPMETVAAWRSAVELMQSFSQGPNIGRNPGPGRSRWPEPDSAREEWPNLDPAHQPLHPARGSYPRADLRLPIGLQRLGEPPFPVLQGAAPGATRMASPIILKPLAISATRAVPLMVLLRAPHVWDADAPPIEIASQFGTVRLTPGQLHMATQALSPDTPGLMAPGRSIRDAFVAWAASRWDFPAVTL